MGKIVPSDWVVNPDNKLVIPSSSTNKLGEISRTYKSKFVSVRSDGCVKFSAGLCKLLSRNYNQNEPHRDRIASIPVDKKSDKIYILMDSKYYGEEDNRKRVRLNHEIDHRGIQRTGRYGEIYLPTYLFGIFLPFPTDDITSVKLVEGTGLTIDDKYEYQFADDDGKVLNTHQMTALMLDAAVCDFDNPKSKIVRRTTDPKLQWKKRKWGDKGLEHFMVDESEE